MSITTAQIRGARGILNWSQQDLAHRTGISATSIGSIENGQTTPRASTLETIRNTFERNGIEFLGLDGVRTRSASVRTYSGKTGFLEFYDDVYHTLVSTPGQVCVSNVDEKEFEMWAGDIFTQHSKRMGSLSNVRYKIMIKEGDLNYLASSYAEYKWIRKELFASVPFYVYGDKLAIVLFSPEPSVILIENKAVSDAYRIQFEVLWETADRPKQIEN